MALLALTTVATGAAQSTSTDDELRLIESTERDLDPLGLDEATGTGLDEAARALPMPATPDPVAQRGDVLTAIAGVSESAHRIRITLDSGLAFVEHAIELSNLSHHAAEVAYRLRVPEDSALWKFSVCRDGACREALPATDASNSVRQTSAIAERNLPGGQVQVIRDGLTRALSMQAGPVQKQSVTLRVAYVTSAALHGGRVRLTLPARGFDPRTVPAEVTVEGSALSERLPMDQFTAEASLTVEVVGTWKAKPGLVRKRARSICDGAPCSREFRAAALQRVSARETWFLLDTSPSMEGVARSRVPAVLTALLSRLPDQTLVRAFAFAATAQDLGRWPAMEVPLSTLDDALLSELGAATRLTSVLTPYHDELARTRPRVIVISDGMLDLSPHELSGLARARRTGAELSLIALADKEPNPRSTQSFREDGGVLHITELADRALTNGELDPLSDRVVGVLSPFVAGRLRAGESEVTERRSKVLRPARNGRDWLPAWLLRHHASPSLIAAPEPQTAAISAPAYADVAPPAPPETTGMPKESVLTLLRTQLVPKARACLRDDRKGRAHYAVGLTFRFLIAGREVLDASIDGQVPRALRDCLLEVLPQLRLPWFTGNLRVRYPIHTDREPEPPVIELETDVAHHVDRVIAGP